MESNVLTSIPGIQYYPIVSLILFFALFAVLLGWFFRVDTSRLNELAYAPLEHDESDASTPSHHQFVA